MTKLKCNVGEYGVIVNSKKEFLILRLPINKEFKKEMWMFPGGRLEEDDQPELGLKREIAEETGLAVKILTPVHVARWGIEKPQKYSTFFLCKLLGKSKVILSKEHTDFRWVNFRSISKIRWHNKNSRIAAEKAIRIYEKLYN